MPSNRNSIDHQNLIKLQKRLIGARRLAEIEAAKAIKRPLDSKLFNMDQWETPK